MIFSQEDLEFEFQNESGYVSLIGANTHMIGAMEETLTDLGFIITGVDDTITGSFGISFLADSSGNPELYEEEIRDYFEESFRMGYEDYNSNFDWES